MTVLYPNMCYNVVCYKGTALYIPGHIAQSVTCLIREMCLTADLGVSSSIPAWSHNFVEIDHEIFLRSFSSLLLIQEGLLSVTSESMCTKYWLTT